MLTDLIILFEFILTSYEKKTKKTLVIFYLVELRKYIKKQIKTNKLGLRT